MSEGSWADAVEAEEANAANLAAEDGDSLKRRNSLERYKPGAYFNEEREKLRRRAHFGEKRLNDGSNGPGENGGGGGRNGGYRGGQQNQRRNNRGGRGGNRRNDKAFNSYRNNRASYDDDEDNTRSPPPPPITTWGEDEPVSPKHQVRFRPR